jgi:hypothetical protein
VKGENQGHSLLDGKQLPSMGSRADRIAAEVWPEFMLHDPIAGRYWHHLCRDWPEYQIALMDRDELLAVGNSVPLYWNGPLAKLPEEGWDWILPKAADDQAKGRRANMQVAIQVMVSRGHQGAGTQCRSGCWHGACRSRSGQH